MKRINLFIAALLMANVLAFSGIAQAGDGSRYEQLQKTQVFFNNSGSTLSAGDAVVLDTSATSGSTLGGYVTTTTSADNVLAIGIVKSRSVADQRPVVVIVEGPAGANCSNSSGTNVVAGTAVGTYTTAGRCDGGTNLGVGIASGDNTDFNSSATKTWIWVRGIGTE